MPEQFGLKVDDLSEWNRKLEVIRVRRGLRSWQEAARVAVEIVYQVDASAPQDWRGAHDLAHMGDSHTGADNVPTETCAS